LFLSPISPEEYIEQRLSDQIGWYDRKSGTNQRWFKRLRFAEIVAAATIPFLSGFAGNSFPDQDCDPCFGRCRSRDRIPPRLATTSGTLLSKENTEWAQSMMKALEGEKRA